MVGAMCVLGGFGVDLGLVFGVCVDVVCFGVLVCVLLFCFVCAGHWGRGKGKGERGMGKGGRVCVLLGGVEGLLGV